MPKWYSLYWVSFMLTKKQFKNDRMTHRNFKDSFLLAIDFHSKEFWDGVQGNSQKGLFVEPSHFVVVPQLQLSNSASAILCNFWGKMHHTTMIDLSTAVLLVYPQIDEKCRAWPAVLSLWHRWSEVRSCWRWGAAKRWRGEVLFPHQGAVTFINNSNQWLSWLRPPH